MKTRESRYVKVARIAYHLTQDALPRYSRIRRTRTTLQRTYQKLHRLDFEKMKE